MINTQMCLFPGEWLTLTIWDNVKVNYSLRITFEAINLNDEPEYYYFGNPSRLSQYDEYGATYGVGFRYILNQ